MLERFNTYSVICQGGLDSNRNFLFLSTTKPGSAISLVNYEPGLYGGYRKLDGYAPLETNFPDVDDTGSEGKILGVAIYDQGIIAARKTKSVTTYQFFFWTASADWTAYTTGLTLTATGVDKIRYDTFNFDGTEKVVFVDGVNNATLHDGTNWINAGTGDTGADFANAGGPMALAAPKYVTVFKNHIFVSGDATSPHIVAHSAPETEYDWTAASGAGQLIIGFEVKQLKPFRDELYVFGETKIKKIVEENNAFVLKDVTTDIGCIASDSVVEYNGDLLFLAQDGIRTIAATERVGDIELGNQTKDIQQDIQDFINEWDLSQLNAVLIRKKSQVRFLCSTAAIEQVDSEGFLGSVRGHPIEHTGTGFEWGLVQGIRASCMTSAYIGTDEYVIHGDYNGKVYRQETGNNFDGADIPTTYTMPYLDFGDVFVRKTVHKILVFLRTELADVILNTRIKFDWDDDEVTNPSSYSLESDMNASYYGTGVYGTSTYSTAPEPTTISNIEGSGFSVRPSFTTNNASGSHSIQAVVFEYSVNGRK